MEEILKYRLIEEIIATNDIVILDQIKSLLTGENGDFGIISMLIPRNQLKEV